ncbi:DUF6810 family protein [Candidatus Lucifugimonas marina]|jgi:hypothetical protein|uniref:DUF6810 domain-containing protein n=1 Tax=Candidatus Lucifugimonas marina TaxID=3038979 RepID=A0AAJ5ZEP9_9CHLR|nr:hypothetical protein [SAR202 cluster bacterium JH702]MDG0869041.1 hypothetical protein [SAR202 cluster bacterium JH639]WFG35663.1 hypothetical protein GKN94_08140 [SAR202 cluster bacterium JH545]WFG39610.1 hypothetical protein GKO48_08255 [SAR202 cluster bacterium JH1073]
MKIFGFSSLSSYGHPDGSNPRQKIQSKNRFSTLISLIAIPAALAFAIGCGGGTSDESASATFVKISDFERVLTLEDITSTGWKKGKTYDVEGLDGAESAYVGFWSPPDLDSLNYEIRIYPSHQVALEKGVPFAEDASGEGASLNAEDALWDEGVRDRRIIVGGGSRGSQNPRYGDFVILGNIVILCEGRTPEHSLDQCAPFVAQITGEGA